MFILTNIYIRPYEFVAVYQSIARYLFMSCSDSIYIGTLKQCPE